MVVNFALFALLLSLPFQLGRHFWLKDSFVFGLKVDYLSPTFYLQDIFIFTLIIITFLKNYKKIFNLQNLVFSFLFLVFVYLNLRNATSPLLSFFTWLRVTELILLGLVFVNWSEKVWQILDQILPFIIIFESFLGFGQMLKQSSFNGFFWFLGERAFNIATPGIARGSFLGRVFLRPYGTFSHPNSLAGFILVSLILLLSKKKIGQLDKAALILGSLLIIASFSRAALAAGVLAGFFYLLNHWRKVFWLKIFCLVFFIPLFFWPQLKTSPSLVARKDLALVAFSLIRTKPLWGVGAGNFILNLARIQPVWEWLFWLQPVHNIFLLIASEIGLTGFLALAALFYFALRQTLQFKILNVKFSVLTALLAIIFTGIFDHYWLTLIQNQLLLALVLSLSFSPDRAKMRQ